ncbi:MAG: 16S rRNA processing protein RimM [Candidatus Eisenbacteria bacterium]|nr:16S rRNA processing protein RimM [Candidatus Eisenbacteria bacterium]
MSRTDEWIEAGFVIRPHGVRGEVIAEFANDLGGLIVEALPLRLTNAAGAERRLEIERARDHKGRKIVKFGDVETVEQAEALRGCSIWMTRTQIGPLTEGRWFVQDILGINVCTEEGESLGTLAEVMHMPANDVYVVRGAGREILLPVIDQVILGVDLEAGRMVVRLMEGMR